MVVKVVKVVSLLMASSMSINTYRMQLCSRQGKGLSEWYLRTLRSQLIRRYLGT